MAGDDGARNPEPLALLGQDSGELMLVNIARGERVALFEGHVDWIFALDADWSSMRAVTGGSDGTVFLWNLTTGIGHDISQDLVGHHSCIRAIAVDWNSATHSQSDVGKEPIFASSHHEGVHRSLSHSSTGHKRPGLRASKRKEMFAVAMAAKATDSVPDSTAAVSQSQRRISQMGSLRSGLLGRSASHGALTRGASKQPLVEAFNVRALTGSDNGRLCLWSINEQRLEKAYDLHLRIVSSLAVDWKRLRVLVGHGDSDLDLIDLDASTTLKSFPNHCCVVSTLNVCWPKSAFVCGSGDSSLAVWDLKRGTQARDLQGHKGAINVAKTHWPTMRALTGSSDQTVRLWNLRQGACLQIFARHEHPIQALSVDWQSGQMISSAAAGPLWLWDITDSTRGPEEVKVPAIDEQAYPASTTVVELLPRDSPWVWRDRHWVLREDGMEAPP